MPEILRGSREGDTHQRKILAEKWQINRARERLWETKKKWKRVRGRDMHPQR